MSFRAHEPTPAQLARTVREANRILGSDGDHEKLVKSVKLIMSFVGATKADKPLGKKYKQASARLAKALRRVEIALKDPDLVLVSVPLLSDDAASLDEALADCVASLRREQEGFAQTKIGRRKPANEAKITAANGAARILKEQGVLLTLTRNGKFCKLAALLYGNEKADLFEACRKVKQKRD